MHLDIMTTMESFHAGGHDALVKALEEELQEKRNAIEVSDISFEAKQDAINELEQDFRGKLEQAQDFLY